LLTKDKRLEFRAPRADATRWQDAADASKMTLSDWIRRACDAHVVASTRRKKRT
jgi:hypothetical protein